MELEVKIDHDASISFVGHSPTDEVYRTIIALGKVPKPRQRKAVETISFTAQISRRGAKLHRDVEDMPLVVPEGGRQPKRAFNVYERELHTDLYNRVKFTWVASGLIYRCDWTLQVDPNRMGEDYDRWFTPVENRLAKLPFGQEELGISRVCNYCPHQFSCLAGQPGGYLIGDDLPERPIPHAR